MSQRLNSSTLKFVTNINISFFQTIRCLSSTTDTRQQEHKEMQTEVREKHFVEYCKKSSQLSKCVISKAVVLMLGCS